MAAGALVSVAGSLMAWVETGSRNRHSYDVFELAERLGFAPDGIEAEALRWWPMMPVLVIGSVVLAWWGLRRTGALVGVLGGLYAGGVGMAVALASASRDIEVRGGAVVTAVGGWVLVASSVAELAVELRTRRATVARARP